MQKYNKGIVALLWGLIVLWQALSPDTAPTAPDGTPIDETAVTDWVLAVSSVLGPLLVYLIPNRGYVNVS